jgi:hypothetical protein
VKIFRKIIMTILFVIVIFLIIYVFYLNKDNTFTEIVCNVLGGVLSSGRLMINIPCN